MQIKLAFSHTPLALFRVTAVVNGRKHAPQPIVTQYRDEGVFLDLLLEAEIDPATHAELIQAVAAAATAPNSAACCEDVDLTPEQLEILRLEPVLSQSD
ncbi:hypothetical protein [Granulicella sp. dw_53]|uniref:hypothetical protein n=1 Tax=Granulicella sp. dw_53 TaxID=2719792 RepID=UPI001BD50C81|nr:hypothetical protein [Granulicella sp. dw_53]